MDGGHCGVPVGLVGDKVGPEIRCRESLRYNDGSSCVERCQECGQQSVDVEERHHQVGAVLGG